MRKCLPASLILLSLLGSWVSAGTAGDQGAIVRVTGAVAHPGEYPLARARTVYGAIGLAGGPLPSADLSRVRIVRAHKEQVTARVVDARWMAPRLARKAAAKPDVRDVALESSDEVTVPTASAGQRNIVTRYFKDVPFAEAVESLLRDSTYGYSIDPAIAQQNLKVTASVKNSPVEGAVRSISQAAGAQCRIEDNSVIITQLPGVNYVQQGLFAGQQLYTSNQAHTSSEPPNTYRDSAAGSGPTQTKTVELRYVEPGSVLPLISNIQGVQSAKTWGRNQITITGPQVAVDEAERAVAQMDTADAYPKPVRITIEIWINKGDQHYEYRTEEVGADGSVIPIELDVDLEDSSLGSGERIRMQGFVTPNILKSPVEGNDVSLSGACRVSGRVFQRQFDKAFSFATSLRSGLDSAAKTLAAGSLSNSGDDFGFKVTGSATIEQGRVVRPSASKPEAALRPGDTAAEAGSLVRLGREQLIRGKLQEAEACFQRAIELDPTNADAHNALGESLSKQGKLDEAIVHLNRALLLDPSRLDYQEDLDKAVRDRGVPLGAGTGN